MYNYPGNNQTIPQTSFVTQRGNKTLALCTQEKKMHLLFHAENELINSLMRKLLYPSVLSCLLVVMEHIILMSALRTHEQNLPSACSVSVSACALFK